MILVKLFGICKDCGHHEFVCHCGGQVVRNSVRFEGLAENTHLKGELLSGMDICELFTSRNFHRGTFSWSITCSECGHEICLPETDCFSFTISYVTVDEWNEIIAKEQYVKKDKETQKSSG